MGRVSVIPNLFVNELIEVEMDIFGMIISLDDFDFLLEFVW